MENIRQDGVEKRPNGDKLTINGNGYNLKDRHSPSGEADEDTLKLKNLKILKSKARIGKNTPSKGARMS